MCELKKKKKRKMKKLSSNKKYILVLIFGLVVLWALAYLCFAFVLLELNPIEWSKSIRVSFVFAFFSILIMSIPISQLIKLEAGW